MVAQPRSGRNGSAPAQSRLEVKDHGTPRARPITMNPVTKPASAPIQAPPHDRDERVTRGAERALARPIQQFALAAEVEALRQEEGWRKTGHSAKTLVKHAGLRIVLITLKQGTRIKEHQAEGTVSIHSISGRLQLHVDEQTLDVPTGGLLVLERGFAHDVEALEDSTFVLSVVFDPA